MQAPDVLAQLARELADPPFEASIAELVELWQVECLRVECVLPPGLEVHPELSVRVRGAFGRRLRALPPRSSATRLLRPAAWDVLAAPLGRLPEGDEVPKPVVLRAGVEDTRLVVEMRVLGRASPWFDDGATALMAALDGDIALRATGGIRVPVERGEMFEDRLSTRMPSESATTATLRFRSPVLARHKHALVTDPRSILRGIVRRVASLARWQATRLQEDWPGINAAIDDLDIDDHDLVSYRWERFSIRRGNAPIPAAGWLGTLRVRGQLARIAPYLVLGETMNAGARASLGLGWYELALA